MKTINIDQLLEIGIALSGEKDCDRLLYTILTAAMDITNCDGGTLYILEDNALTFRVMITKSMGVDLIGEAITIPPVPLSSSSNVCSRTAKAGTLFNIPNVYEDERFDFSGTRRYDKMTGFQTVSLLCLPMKNDRNEVIGVLQLINAQNNAGQTVPFAKDYEKVIMSLSSQSAICLTNRNYSEEITALLHSFVEVMSAAIDERSPYNANHTRNMAKYGERFIHWLDNSHHTWRFSSTVRREFLMSIWLHDVGKLVTPLEIMDKETRLGSLRDGVLHRFELIKLYHRIDFLEGHWDSQQYEQSMKIHEEALQLVEQANRAPFITDDLLEQIQALAQRRYTDPEGREQPWLRPDEVEALSVRKGTLTGKERAVMEHHVEMTEQMLGKMKFTGDFTRAPLWAAMHHEFINGRGYPKGLSGDALPKEVRLLTILDIFDALTARDRPYKKPMTAEAAFSILGKMADDGQIDRDILELFKESGAYNEPDVH